MKIAIINEVNTSIRSGDTANALHKTTNAEVLSVGTKNPEQTSSLTYIHTSYMAAVPLNTGSCDFVIGGCGVGQGFLSDILQFPGVVYGLIVGPLDVQLFSQISGGSCVSLPLNKGYGWVGSVNLEYISEKLFVDPTGVGYPEGRVKSQTMSRQTLASISKFSHEDSTDVLKAPDSGVLKTIAGNKNPMRVLADGDEKAKMVLELLRENR